ncbi:hypothetical protein Micbo1qcDRAFT_167621, partial [Microdochium bolleyi]
MRVSSTTLVPAFVIALVAAGGAAASKCHPRPPVVSSSSSASATGIGSSTSATSTSSTDGTSTPSSASGTSSMPTTSASVTSSTSSAIASSSSSASTFNPSGYTFYEVPLPVVFDGTAASKLAATSTYTLEPATQTGTPSCIVDAATATSAKFQILDNAGNRFIANPEAVKVLTDADFPS